VSLSRRALLPVLFLLMVSGCTPTEPHDAGGITKEESEAEVLETRLERSYADGWGFFVARQPEVLQRLLKESPGWVKLYNRDYQGAQEAFEKSQTSASKIGLGRSHVLQSEFYHLAYVLAADIDLRYLKLWEENSGRLVKTAQDDYSAGMALLNSGDASGALIRFEAVRAAKDAAGELQVAASVMEGVASTSRGDGVAASKSWARAKKDITPFGHTFLSGMRQGAVALEGGPNAEVVPQGYALKAHLWSLVQADELDRAKELLKSFDPKMADLEVLIGSNDGKNTENDTDGVARRYFDPIILKALARLHAKMALKVLTNQPLTERYQNRARAVLNLSAEQEDSGLILVTEDTLPLYLFSAYPSPADMRADVGPDVLEGAVIAQFIDALGPVPAESGAGEDTRRAVVMVQVLEDAGRRLVDTSENQEGRNTVLGLRVIDKDANLALRKRASQYFEAGRFLEAVFLIERALDKDNTSVTFLNDPHLYLEITHAYCVLGRYREAMNYFYRLLQVRPELWLIQENLGNLSVLGTVDNPGVSHRD